MMANLSFNFQLFVFCLLLIVFVVECRPKPTKSTSTNSTYALISFHGGSSGIENVFRYSLPDGTLLGPVIQKNENSTLDQLRGLLWKESANQLYFLNAHKSKNDVELMQSSSTCADPGPVVGISKAKLNHPYDAVMDDKYLYVTDQDGGNIVRMTPDFSQAKVIGSVADPRGLSFGNNGLLYISSDSLNVIVYMNVTTGLTLGSFPADKAIDLAPYEDLIIYGTRGKKTSIHAWSTTTKSDAWEIKTDDLDHAAGMFVDGSTLYVLSQQTKALLAFDLASQTYIGTIISNLPDYPECLQIIHC